MSKWIFPALKPKKGFQSSPQTKAGKVETHQKCYPSSKVKGRGFPAGSTEKNPPANAKDIGLIPGLGRSHMPCGIAKEKVKAVKGKEQSQIGGDEHDN